MHRHHKFKAAPTQLLLYNKYSP